MMCVRKVSSSCCIPLSGANRLSRKKEKKKKEKNLLLSENQPHMAEVFLISNLCFLVKWVVNQKHNQHIINKRHHEQYQL